MKSEIVEAKELQIGDVVKIEYGMEGNFVKCVVTDISKELYLNKFFEVKAVSSNSKMDMDFCVRPNEEIKRLAA